MILSFILYFSAAYPQYVGYSNKNKLPVKKNKPRLLYHIDEAKTIRKSHENPYIQRLYKEYLGEPNGEKAHKLLHTKYVAREPRGIK